MSSEEEVVRIALNARPYIQVTSLRPMTRRERENLLQLAKYGYNSRANRGSLLMITSMLSASYVVTS